MTTELRTTIQVIHGLEDTMRNVLRALLLLLFTSPMQAQGAPPQGGTDQPYTMEYYYKVQWGRAAEVPAAFPQEPLPAVKENRCRRPHACGEN